MNINKIKIINYKKMDNKLWVEKYRAKFLKDIFLPPQIKIQLKIMFKIQELSNLVFYGTSGVGKTTLVKIISNNLYKSKKNECILELNASDDRGIKIVMDTMVNFCKRSINIMDENICTKHKLIILDEADNLTEKSQRLISGLMDEYTNVKFIYICNNFDKLLEMITTRCIIMKFIGVEDENITHILKKICMKEEIEYEKNSLETLALISKGDVRYAINNLQLIYWSSNKITIDNINSICSMPTTSRINELLKTILNLELKNSKIIMNELFDDGYCINDICITLLLLINKKKDITNNIKLFLNDKIGECIYISNNGISSELQMLGTLIELNDGLILINQEK